MAEEVKCGARHPDWEDRHYKLECDRPKGHPVPLILDDGDEEIECDHAYLEGGAFWTGEYRDYVYQLLMNGVRWGLFRTIDGAKAAAAEDLDGMRISAEDVEDPDDYEETVDQLEWELVDHYTDGPANQGGGKGVKFSDGPFWTAVFTATCHYAIAPKRVGP